MASSNGFQS
jgi:hypothetical protein